MKKNLKKILLLVLVVLTCGFVSCKTTNKTTILSDTQL